MTMTEYIISCCARNAKQVTRSSYPDFDLAREVERNLSDPNVIYVARRNVGVFALRIGTDADGKKVAREFVHFVEPEAAKTKEIHLIVEEAIDIARQKGVDRVEVYVPEEVEHADAAKKLYNNHGFRVSRTTLVKVL